VPPHDADKRVIEPLEAAGKTAVIPPKKNRKSPRTYDKELYEARHLIENFFCWVKQFRAIAVRGAKVRALLHFSLAPIRRRGLSASCAAVTRPFRAEPSRA
jgi:transposase